MDYVKAQEELVGVMESWRDVTMAPDDPSQPQSFQQAQQQYNKIQNLLRQQQMGPAMDSRAVINADRAQAEAAKRAAAVPGAWTDIKNLTSDALQRGAQVSSGIPGAGFALRQLANIDRANMGDAIATSFQSYLGDPDVEESLAGVVRGDKGAQAGYDELLPGFMESREATDALTDRGVGNIMQSFGQEGIGTGLKSLWDDPVAAYNLVGTTLGRSPASVALGAGGTALGTGLGFVAGGPPGAAAGAMAGGAFGGGAGGYMDERTGGIIRMLEEKGFDIANPAHIQLLQENPEVFDLASDQANKRALAIGAFSAISGAVSAGLGRVAAGPAIGALGKWAVPARFGAAGGSIPASGILESGGEFAAQQVAGQPTNWADVKLEGVLGSLIDAPITATSMASTKFAPHSGELNDRTRALAAKEAQIIAESLPFGGMANIVTGEVMKEDGSWSGSAELIPDVEGRGEQLIINIDNLIRRSDGTRSGIKAQLLEDVTHELSGHSLVQKLLTGNENFVAEAFKANKDLITPWFKKSAYAEGPEALNFKENESVKVGNDNGLVYEEWASGLAELDVKILRRIELAIVNYLHKLIGKDATAKLLKSWDARNITVRNMARDHMKQLKERRAAGETQPVQTITAEQSEALLRPGEEGVRESRGKLESPSRRKFLKQAAGTAAVAAVDPSILLEPATTPAVEAPMYTGMTEQFPGSIYEFSIATDPDAGWTSADDPGEGDMDVSFTHDPNTNEVTVYEDHKVVDTFEVDDMHADAEVLDYVRDQYGPESINDVRVQREEMERDPFTGEGEADYWGDADERFDDMAMNLIQGEKTMAGVERVDRGTAYDYFDEPTTPRLPEQETPRLPEPKALAIEKPTQKALPAPKETTEKTDAELYVETIDEIMNIYDEDATAAEAARDGTLNNRIISYAAETPFTREELWEGVNERIEALAEDTAEPTARRREARARKPKSETVQRDINEEKGKVNRRISALDVEEAEKEERNNLLKRLQNIMGAPARKRGINAGDQDVFKEQAAKIVAGDLEAVEAFIKPFEEKKTGGTETAYIADRRRTLRAERIGKTDAEILKYRPKGAKHPMEGKMTYPFATEEIDRQEKAGEITAEEAEIRRLAVNNVRRIFKGKAGPTVKRTITEAVYGIGAYEDLVPWAEVYTEEQAEKMGERAEVAQAEARRTRYDPTDITANQRKELLKGKVTAEETAWINSDEMPELKTKRERLLFLRSPTEFKSETEEKELNDFRAALKERKPYDQKKEAAKREKEKEDIVSKAMAEGRYEQLPPADVTKLTYYQRSVVNIEPTDWDRIRVRDDVDRETAFEVYGDAFTEQGERIDESEMELLDPIGVTPKRRESRAKVVGPPTPIDSLNILASIGVGPRANKVSSIVGKFLNGLHSGKITSQKQVDEYKTEIGETGGGIVPDTTELKTQMQHSYAFMKKVRDLAKRKGISNAQVVREQAVKEAAEWLDKSESRIIDLENDGVMQLGLETRITDGKYPRYHPEYRAALIPLEDAVKDGPTMSTDHVVAFANKGLNFIFNMLPMPLSNNRALGSRSILGLELQEKLTEKQQQALNYIRAISYIIENREGKTDGQVLIDAGVAAGMWTQAQVDMTKYNALGDLPPMGVIPDLDIFKDADGKPLGHLEIVSALYRLSAEEAVTMDNLTVIEAAKDSYAANVRRNSKGKEKDKAYTEHFNDGFWYTITSFLWGKPVQSIRDINKSSRFGSKRGKITAADKIADLVQRAISSTKRTEGMEMGTDMMQDVSMRSGEFYTQLSRIFALATGRAGDIDAKANKQMVDYLMGRDVVFSDPDVKEASKQLKTLLESVYKYGKDATSNLETPLNLRGEADTIVPRVWNIEYIATRKGKAAFLRAVNKVLHERTDISVTPEEMYESVINSGGFVQGDWTNMKADQTRTDKDIERDQLIAETLDMMPTQSMMDSGLVIDDVQALVPRFIQKAIERTEYSRRFGTSDELLRGMINEGLEQIRTNNREVLKLGENKDGLMHIDERKFTKAVWDMARILRNQYGYDMANMPTRKWLQRAANTETILKLPFVTLASIPEFFTPMLKGDVRPDKWFVDFMAGTAWAGYKGMNGLSKLLFNKHLPAMRKASKDIGGMGIISDVQLLRELGIADIQAMGDLVSTRYANPNFARGGLRAGAKGTIAGKVPKKIRAVFNMQTYMQGTLLTTITEMQQLMALRNFQRHMGRRVQFVNKNKGKSLTGRKARLMKQFTQDLADYGIVIDIDLNTEAGRAEFNAGALRFIDQVITRPNDATTAKAFKNPLTAPLVLFKRFITTYGNTLMTSIGNDFATKVDNVERAKQVAQVASVAMIMYGSVMFAEIIRGVLKGDLDEEDFKLMPDDFAQFMRRLDRTGLSSAPGAVAINLAFPYKRGWWDTTQSRIMNELLGPLGGDLTALGDALISGKNNSWDRLLGQAMPSAKPLLKKKKRVRRRSMVGQGTIY